MNSDFYVIVNEKDKIETKVSVDSLDDKIYGSIVGRIDVLLNGEKIGYRYLYYKKKSVTEDKSFISKLLDFLKFW